MKAPSGGGRKGYSSDHKLTLTEQRVEIFNRMNDVAVALGLSSPGGLVTLVNKLIDTKEYNRAIVYNVKRGTGKLPDDFIVDLCAVCPAVNREYIYHGIGKPLLEDVPLTWINKKKGGEQMKPRDVFPEGRVRPLPTHKIVASDLTMADWILPGDELHFEYVSPSDTPLFGRIYNIRIKGSTPVIRVILATQEPGVYLLRSKNASLAPDIRVNREEIISMELLISSERNWAKMTLAIP
jgi:hypothetical protein